MVVPVQLSADQTTLARLESALSRMNPRARINVLLSLGVPADTVMGVETCAEHPRGRPMAVSEPLTFDGSSLWCKECWKWITTA